MHELSKKQLRVHKFVCAVLWVYLFVGGEHMLTALKINVQIVYYVVEFAFFAVGHTHMCVCMSVCVCVWVLMTLNYAIIGRVAGLLFVLFFFFWFLFRLWFYWTLSTCWLRIENIFLLSRRCKHFFWICCVARVFVAAVVLPLLLLFFIACLHSWCAWWTFSRTFASCQRQRNVKCVAIAEREVATRYFWAGTLTLEKRMQNRIIFIQVV